MDGAHREVQRVQEWLSTNRSRFFSCLRIFLLIQTEQKFSRRLTHSCLEHHVASTKGPYEPCCSLRAWMMDIALSMLPIMITEVTWPLLPRGPVKPVVSPTLCQFTQRCLEPPTSTSIFLIFYKFCFIGFSRQRFSV